MLTELETAEAWKKYETLKDLYKFYVGQLIDFHRFYFLIAGGLVVFVLTNREGPAALSLLLPLVISLGGVVTFIFGIGKSRELTEAIKAVARELRMLSAHSEVLEFLCWAFLAVHVLMVVGLAWLLVMFWPDPGWLSSAPPAPTR